MSVTLSRETQKFGDDKIVCAQCGFPKPGDAYMSEDAIICNDCIPQVEAIHRLTMAKVTPERKQSAFMKEMDRHLKQGKPATITGFEKAMEILGGRTPQELAATMIKELEKPGFAREDLSEAQRAALPKDYKTLYRFISMLESSGRFRDEQIAKHNPLEGLSVDEIYTVVMQGTVDYTRNDPELRKTLIRGFLERCPTFLDEVMEVMADMEKEKNSGATVKVLKPVKEPANVN